MTNAPPDASEASQSLQPGELLVERIEDGKRVQYVVARRAASQNEPPPPPQPPLEEVPHFPPQGVTPPAVQPIDLSTALAMTSGQNPQVNFARWRIQEAYARWDAAKVMWLPTLQAGSSYNRHDGTLQSSRGIIEDINRSSLQAGLGAGAVGAGSVPQPGLLMRFHVTDAIFAPRIAERTAWARQHGARAELQDQLLMAAEAYINLLEASQTVVIAEDTLDNAATLHRLTADFARSGQGLQADADRLAVELALRRNAVTQALEQEQVASARLAEVLNLDPALKVVPAESTLVPIDLVPPHLHREELVSAALANRPELRETSALVAAADEQYRREQWAPFVPNMFMGLSYGGFGGGLGDHIGSFHDRVDFDALAYWEVRNLGLGEVAARDTANAQIEQARFRRVAVRNRISRETVEAAAQVEARRQLIAESEAAVHSAVESYHRNLQRIREGAGLPIEALQSMQALDESRRAYLRAIADYDRAQFRLHRALGWPAETSPAQ